MRMSEKSIWVKTFVGKEMTADSPDLILHIDRINTFYGQSHVLQGSLYPFSEEKSSAFWAEMEWVRRPRSGPS